MKPKEFNNLVENFGSKFSELSNIDYEGLEAKRIELKQKFDEFRNSGEQLLGDNDTLEIGIVGQMKAGKSSFLNAMLFDGEEILPEAPTPMTAGLTVIEYSEENYFEVEFFSNDDWNELKRLEEAYSNMERQIREAMAGQSEENIKTQIDSSVNVECKSAHEVIGRLSAKAKKKIGGEIDKIPFEHISDLKGILNSYVGARGEYTSVVKCTRILLKDNHIQGLKIVDTPGINDPIVSREQRTNMELGSCHGVFFLSRADQFMVQQDVDFMTKMINSKGVARLVILASMFDVAMCTSPESGTFDDIYQRELNLRRNTYSETMRRIGDEELKDKARLDIVCGMAASIVYKLRNGIQLSNFEDKVVQNMKQYFPNDFTNNDNIIANFAKIANIEELDEAHPGIRKNHLEGTFLRNKDRIIGEKIQNFFEASSYDILECIERLIKDYTREKNIVENTSLNDLNAKGQAQARLFNNIEGCIINILDRFTNDVQACIDKEVKNMDFPDITIPTSYQYRTFDYLGSKSCGFLWLKKKDVVLSKSFSYTGIDTSTLRNKVNETFETCAKKLSKGWKEAITESLNKLPKEITDEIFKLAANDQAATFDQDFYLNLSEHALDDMRKFSDLDLKQVIDDWERKIFEKYCQQYIPSGYGFDKLRDNEVTNRLNEYSKSYINSLATNIRTNGRTGIRKLGIEAINQLDSLKFEVDELKKNINDRIKKDVQAYLDQLQKRIQDKTNSIKNIDKIITKLGELKQLFTQVGEQNSNTGTKNIRRRR